MKKTPILCLLLLMFCSTRGIAQPAVPGKVTFKSSDEGLTRAFAWAKQQALSYAHDGDPVGYWYEAALPGREAFCMRDVSHQSIGAAVLGLQTYNRNMFLKFAENISESKDYCTYWEINRFGNPAPVDYRNDKDFWYNLPANFDLLDACYRQYLWTGDPVYAGNERMLNFYEKTIHEYVDRWQLSVEEVQDRDRLINLPEPSVASNSFFFKNRGIPTYNEGGKGETLLGIDMTASMLAAYRAYSRFAAIRGDTEEAQRYQQKAREVSAFLDRFWWDEKAGEYRTIWYEDGSFDHSTVGENQAFSHYLLYFRAIEDPKKIKALISRYAELQHGLIIELVSHLPNLFYRYGAPEAGDAAIKYMSDPATPRREYPENSFAIVGDLVTGLMGVAPDATQNMLATHSRLAGARAWAQIDRLPVLGKEISIRHEGRQVSTLTNHSEQPLIWKACFDGRKSELSVNGNRTAAEVETDLTGREISCAEVVVSGGAEVEVHK